MPEKSGGGLRTGCVCFYSFEPRGLPRGCRHREGMGAARQQLPPMCHTVAGRAPQGTISTRSPGTVWDTPAPYAPAAPAAPVTSIGATYRGAFLLQAAAGCGAAEARLQLPAGRRRLAHAALALPRPPSPACPPDGHAVAAAAGRHSRPPLQPRVERQWYATCEAGGHPWSRPRPPRPHQLYTHLAPSPGGECGWERDVDHPTDRRRRGWSRWERGCC